MEKELKNYLDFWKDKSTYLSFNDEKLKKIREIDYYQNNGGVFLPFILTIVSVLIIMFDISFRKNTEIFWFALQALVILPCWFFWAKSMFKGNSQKKILSSTRIDLIDKFYSELDDDENIKSIFCFLVPYVEKNIEEESFNLKKFIQSIEADNISKNDVIWFLELNKEVQDLIEYEKEEKELTSNMTSFFKKKQININFNDNIENYEKQNVKEKYLQML